MLRGSGNESINHALGLGPHLVGKQVLVNGRSLEICEQLAEGGFSFVYLARNKGVIGGNNDGDVTGYFDGKSKLSAENKRLHPPSQPPIGNHMVLKITSVHNATQRHIAEKEAKLLQTLSHPSIVQVYDHGLRERGSVDGSFTNADSISNESSRLDAPNGESASPPNANAQSKVPQYLILMEYCEGGTAFDVINRMKLSSPTRSFSGDSRVLHRFDLPSLVISFGQICNAVSYLHAQRPPITHRDLKPVNFLIKSGSYKLCDFGSAVIGHTDLRTPESRRKAEEVVNKTTTQMFRAPEMVDLYMSKRLTESTDVWALGCCLYSLAFLADCFEEGSNLAILSRKYKIPDDNPYGEGLVDLIDRMLSIDYKERADMSEVIMCLSALYSGRPLPKRKRGGKPSEEEKGEHRKGAYRTDGQGIGSKSPAKKSKKIIAQAKRLNPNSAAAKRKKAQEQMKSAISPAQVNANTDGFNQSTDVMAGGVQNFASFDREFGENLDHFPKNEDVDSSFDCSLFDDRCQI
ncbi:hypothetical protein ACHAWF_012720 [Thalassiosira exigua]